MCGQIPKFSLCQLLTNFAGVCLSMNPHRKICWVRLFPLEELILRIQKFICLTGPGLGFSRTSANCSIQGLDAAMEAGKEVGMEIRVQAKSIAPRVLLDSFDRIKIKPADINPETVTEAKVIRG